MPMVHSQCPPCARPGRAPTAARARAQVWIITGDKQETAVNIAVACNLICRPIPNPARPACAQVWMITGDKQETAVNIAVACRLVHRPAALLKCNAPGSAEAAAARLAELLAAAGQGSPDGARVR